MSVIACIVAFGGFLSSVYAFERAKTADKAVQQEQSVPAPQRQYDERAVVRVREIMLAARQNLLEEEKKNVAEAQHNLEQRITEFKEKIATQNRIAKTANLPPKRQLAQTSLSAAPALPVIPSVSIPIAPIVLATLPPINPISIPPLPSIPSPPAPSTTVAPIVPPPPPHTTTKPRTTVS
ncbi:hypothetical protein HY250_03840 [Candidatus Azambacteria bacterium]|nr:hypothetical protein [Candidatus Azambacteria bacterium]